MNLLAFPGKGLYSLVVCIASLGGVVVSVFLILGSAFGSLSIAYIAALVLGNLATLGLLVGCFFSFSRHESESIALLTLLSATFLPSQAVYSTVLRFSNANAVPLARTPYGYYSLIVVDAILVILAFTKFMQLRKLR